MKAPLFCSKIVFNLEIEVAEALTMAFLEVKSNLYPKSIFYRKDSCLKNPFGVKIWKICFFKKCHRRCHGFLNFDIGNGVKKE